MLRLYQWLHRRASLLFSAPASPTATIASRRVLTVEWEERTLLSRSKPAETQFGHRRDDAIGDQERLAAMPKAGGFPKLPEMPDDPKPDTTTFLNKPVS
jgi:hypothetical protein